MCQTDGTVRVSYYSKYSAAAQQATQTRCKNGKQQHCNRYWRWRRSICQQRRGPTAQPGMTGRRTRDFRIQGCTQTAVRTRMRWLPDMEHTPGDNTVNEVRQEDQGYKSCLHGSECTQKCICQGAGGP